MLRAACFLSALLVASAALAFQAAPPPGGSSVPAKKVFMVMETSKGDVLLELDAEKAPISVANFQNYAKKGYYDGTIFHRVINGFMIQGGGFDQNYVQKATDAAIRNEWQNGLKNRRGTIAMARTNAPDSATSQFYINVEDNAALDGGAGPGYAVFGKVIGGMDVVDVIKAVPTGRRPLTMGTPDGKPIKLPSADVPVEMVLIKKVSEVSADEMSKRVAAAASKPKPPAAPAAPAAPAPPAAPAAPAAPAKAPGA